MVSQVRTEQEKKEGVENPSFFTVYTTDSTYPPKSRTISKGFMTRRWDNI